MPISSLDPVDLRILKELQESARMTNVELAERVSLSPSPCLRRVRILEESGIIRKYVTLVDPNRVGLGVSVFVEVTLAVKTVDSSATFERAIQDFSEVVECHIMSGSSDYLLRVVVPDIPSFRHFAMARLLAVPGVATTRSSFSLGQVKYTTSLPLQTSRTIRGAVPNGLQSTASPIIAIEAVHNDADGQRQPPCVEPAILCERVKAFTQPSVASRVQQK